MRSFPHALFGMRDFDIKIEVKADFRHDDGQWRRGRRPLDRVYLYLTEKPARYADVTSENCKRIIRKKALKFVMTLSILTS